MHPAFAQIAATAPRLTAVAGGCAPVREGVNSGQGDFMVASARAYGRANGGKSMKTAQAITAALALASAAVSTPADAQSTRHGTAYGSDWGYHMYTTGAAARVILDGRPAFGEAQPEAMITIMSRDGRALTEADRPYAIRVAQSLCEQSGRRFNTQTTGHWRDHGGLSFQGACSQW